MEHIKVSDKMRRIADFIILERSEELGWIKQQNVKIQYLTSDANKKSKGVKVFGECKKANATIRELGDCDYIIIFYTNNTCNFTEKQLHILMYHELLHIRITENRYTIRNHDVIMGEFSEIINQYGKYWAELDYIAPQMKSADEEYKEEEQTVKNMSATELAKTMHLEGSGNGGKRNII